MPIILDKTPYDPRKKNFRKAAGDDTAANSPAPVPPPVPAPLLSANTKKILLWAGIAIAGYFLYKKFKK